MTMVDEIRKELDRISRLNKESARIKARRNKPIKFKDEDFLNKYYRDQDDLLYLPDLNSGRAPTVDELTEEEQMNRLEDRKKKSTKMKMKRKICKCKK